jgi:hypothetical protein
MIALSVEKKKCGIRLPYKERGRVTMSRYAKIFNYRPQPTRKQVETLQ